MAATAFAIVGLRRKSGRAAAPVHVRRVLIVNAGGGLRTSTAFNASPVQDLNPWGVMGTFGALRLGNVLRGDESTITYAAPSWPGSPTVPRIDQLAPQLAIIGGADHAPDGSPRAGDHGDDTPRMGTGYYSPDAPGLLSVLNRYIGGGAAAPIATIGGGEFGASPPAWVADKPIALQYYELPGQPPQGGSATVGQPLELALDSRMLARHRNLAHDAVQNVVNTKAALRKYGPVLADKRLRFDSAQYLGQTLDGVTNQMIVEAVGATDGDASNVAMALRLLQLGAPAVSVSIGGFDTHDHEVQRAPQLYTRFARFVAGVHFALSNIPSGSGVLLDDTLVVTTSEFGRSGVHGGFNAGQGTDHGNGPGWRYQAHVVFGAGVKPKLLHATDDNNVPVDRPLSTHCLLATIAAAAGVPQDAIDARWPASALYPEGGPLWDLWA